MTATVHIGQQIQFQDGSIGTVISKFLDSVTLEPVAVLKFQDESEGVFAISQITK